MIGRIIAWGLTGVVFGVLLILAIVLFPWVDGILVALFGGPRASAVRTVVVVVLAALMVAELFSFVYYLVQGAIRQRIEFRLSDFTVVGVGLGLTLSLLVPLLGLFGDPQADAALAVVVVILTAVIVTGPIVSAFYLVSGAIGRRIEFQNSDLTILGMSLTLTVGLLAPYVLYPVFVMKVLCFALFACAFNLLIGFVGLLSFGHAAYFGAAGYVSGHVAKVWGWPPELAILSATAVAVVLGALFGGIAIRRQGIYFAMITLALAQMIYFFALQAKFTGGEDGIQAIPRGHLFGIIDLNQPLAMYYTVLAIFIAGFLLIYRTIHSPFGQVLKAIRENEPRAISLGYSVDRYKLVAFVLSAGLAGLAGGTKSIVFQLASLTDVQWQMSGEVVLMTLLGGIGTVFGPIVGAALQMAIENFFAQTGAWVTIITGGIFVVCVLTFRRGIVGEFTRLFSRRMAGLSPTPRSAMPRVSAAD